VKNVGSQYTPGHEHVRRDKKEKEEEGEGEGRKLREPRRRKRGGLREGKRPWRVERDGGGGGEGIKGKRKTKSARSLKPA